MSELSAEHRQFIYLSETTRLIRHLGALAKLAKLRYEHGQDGSVDWAHATYCAYLTALGAAILDDTGTHHYTAQMARKAGEEWFAANEDQIQV